MPIDLATVLKQIGRNNSQNGNVNTFYYLVDTADIDFRVEGRIGTGGILPDFPTPSVEYGQKYIVIDPAGIPVELGTIVNTPSAGDIIERREDGWYIHLDVSGTKTDGGALAYSKHDKKFYYYKNGTGWVELGAGSVTGAAGDTWSIQFRSTDGSLSGDAGLLFNNSTNQLVLGPDVVIAFGDGTTQGTARNFYGLTGPTAPSFPLGMSGAGNTGDRLLLATGSSADPFRNYVRFGTGWFQTGVVGIGQGPQGIQGTAGATGETGTTGETGARGETGYGFTAAFVSGDGELYISTLFPDGLSGNERSIGIVRGSDGVDGVTGSTGFGFTAAFVSGDGELYISTLFPDGSSGNERSIGVVRGADGAAGETGATGFTGATGSTGYGFTAAFVSGDGELYISTLFPDGSSGNERSIGVVRGADGAAGETGATGFTGATGSTGYGFTAAFVSGDGYLYISTLFPSGESGNERSIGFVRGETGNTGTFSIGLSVGDPYSFPARTASFVSGEAGTARKFAFLLEDGSLTFDFVKNVDIFNLTDFQFAVLSFSATSFDTIRLLSDSLYDLSSSTFNVSYRLGPPATAFIFEVTSEASPSLSYFPTAAMNSRSGAGISLTGIGGGDKQTTLTVSAQGFDSDGDSRIDSSKTIVVKFRNDYLTGMTAASVITGGGPGTTGINAAWMQRDYTSTIPVAQTLSGYTKSSTAAMDENYIYFAYPSRLHNDSSPPQFQIYKTGTAPLASGGMVLQGYGFAFDEGGLSTLNYTNSQGYVEPYKVWRSEQSFPLGDNMTLRIV